MQFDNIYLFNIFYLDNNGKEKDYKTYNDNGDVYSLQNLPNTTYFIEKYRLTKNFEGSILNSDTNGDYLIGTPLTIEDLEKEIEGKEIKTAADKKYLKEFKNWRDNILNSKKQYVIFRKRGKLLCLFKYEYPGEIIGDIKDGKIVKATENDYNNDNYTDLE